MKRWNLVSLKAYDRIMDLGLNRLMAYKILDTIQSELEKQKHGKVPKKARRH